MVRKFLYIVAFCIVLFIAGRIALAFWPEALTRTTFTPTIPYEPQPALAPKAYTDPAMWLAHPGMGEKDASRWLPDGFTPEQGTPLDVAVFFVHPTSYLKKTHWNAPLDDPDARRIAEIVTRANASVFGRAAEVWAPRYRQATLGAFVSDDPQARQALDLAYQDVARAFDAFLAAQPADKPIVLAGHSQGSYLIKRLLKDRVAGTPLARRILAVYAIGWLIDSARDLPAMGLPACAGPQDTGCVVSYLSFTTEGDTAMMRNAYERFAWQGGASPVSHYLCWNPLTGTLGGAAPASANSGGIVPDARMEHARFTPALAGAACADDGTLRIGAGPEMGPFVLPGGNYHVYDYALFWNNLRADFARRVAAWPARR